MLNLLITGGRVIDGTGAPAIYASVAVEGDRLRVLRGDVSDVQATRRIDATGKVVRGPAPLSLALANVSVDNDNVFVSQWTETDFRTGEKPWWS